MSDPPSLRNRSRWQKRLWLEKLQATGPANFPDRESRSRPKLYLGWLQTQSKTQFARVWFSKKDKKQIGPQDVEASRASHNAITVHPPGRPRSAMTGANKCLFGGGKESCQKHRMYGEQAAVVDERWVEYSLILCPSFVSTSRDIGESPCLMELFLSTILLFIHLVLFPNILYIIPSVWMGSIPIIYTTIRGIFFRQKETKWLFYS